MATTRRNAQRTTTSLNPLKPVNNNKNVGGTKRALEENGPETKRRRAAFGDLTNANALKNNGNMAKITKKVVKKEGGKKKTVVTVAVPKISAEKQISQSQPAPSNVEKTEMPMPNSQPEKETSFDYVELSQGSQSSSSSSQSSLCEDDFIAEMNEKNNLLSQDSKMEEKVIEPDWVDIDAEHMKDPFQCGLYSAHIFQYYKDREADFVINDYLSTKQKDLTPNMRAILVDWLVEVQENFELNHETLYLAVKLVDRYLCLATLPRDRLQLLGATCLFIACQFDERCPPVLDDFLYICDDAYRREELIGNEMKVLKPLTSIPEFRFSTASPRKMLIAPQFQWKPRTFPRVILGNFPLIP
uniref:CyclinB protein 3 n=1 Tax=Platynereis dumerilii TaxID=6359 RepID=I7K145_PLADU|nr:CyclinB protein 3 [Platynereis dumerilii]